MTNKPTNREPVGWEKKLDELEAVIKQQLDKYGGRILGDEKCRDGSYIPQPILDYVKQFIRQTHLDLLREVERAIQEYHQCCVYHDSIFSWVDGGECGMAGMADKPSICCENCPSKYHQDNHLFTSEATDGEKIESLETVIETIKQKIAGAVNEGQDDKE